MKAVIKNTLIAWLCLVTVVLAAPTQSIPTTGVSDPIICPEKGLACNHDCGRTGLQPENAADPAELSLKDDSASFLYW